MRYRDEIIFRVLPELTNETTMTSLRTHHISLLHAGICGLASGRACAIDMPVMFGLSSRTLEQTTNDYLPESWKGNGMT